MLTPNTYRDSQVLLPLFQKVVDGVFPNYQILRVQRSFTNEIIGFETIFDSNPDGRSSDRELSDYRLLYTLKKSLDGRKTGTWIHLHDKMILPLNGDEVFVTSFDSHLHTPREDQISIALGYDGVSKIVDELVSQRMISKAINELIDHQRPFAFGIINIDNFESLKAELEIPDLSALLSSFEYSIHSILAPGDQLEALDGNEYAVVLSSKSNIDEIFPRLVELSNLSLSPINIASKEEKVEFSAGYVLVTDSFVSVKEILDEAISMMYKSKSDGKNGYQISKDHQLPM